MWYISRTPRKKNLSTLSRKPIVAQLSRSEHVQSGELDSRQLWCTEIAPHFTKWRIFISMLRVMNLRAALVSDL